eukprot:2738401-Lingulodinium_polyedra.AAC.1
MLSGTPAVKPSVQRICNCFASAATAREPENTLMLLCAMKDSPSWRMSPACCQSVLTWAITTVSKLVEEKPLDISAGAQGEHAGSA